MNPKDEITPEEKLLHLIRRSDKKNPREKNIDQPKPSTEDKLSKPVEPSAIPKVSKVKETKMIFASIKSIDFVLINRLILLIASVALVLFSFDLYLNSQKISRQLLPLNSKTKVISLKEKETKPYSYYQQEISKRNLFRTGPMEAGVNKVVPAGSTFKELIKDLHLLGIVSGDNPQVIIEDRKLQKTYFLNTGDYLGEIKVEAIHSGSVILEFKGEKINLFL